MEIEISEIFCVETFCIKCILDVQNKTKKWESSVAHKATYKKNETKSTYQIYY